MMIVINTKPTPTNFVIYSSQLLMVGFKPNQIVFVTCAEYNMCRLYSEMLTDKPITNHAVEESLLYHQYIW